MKHTYEEAIFGQDQPEIAIALGREHKRPATALGDTLTLDSDGNPILDNECYVLDSTGLHLLGTED